MGTALTGLEIKDTYDSLIKVTDNGPLSGTLKALSDGLGNDSALALSTAGASVAGSLALRSAALATAATQILVVSGDPSSTTRDILTRTPAQIRSDIGAGTGDGTVTGTGTSNFVSKFTSASAIGNSSIFDNGNVGIGNSAPTAKLDVTGTFTASGAATLGSTLAVSGNATFDTNTLFVDAANNRVGIGTVTPAGDLHIASATDGGIRIQGGASGLSYIDLADTASGTPAGSIAYNHIANAITFSTGGSNAERVRITSTGSVGIGTTAPTEKLQLSNGKLFLSEVDESVGGKIYGYNDTSVNLYAGGLKFQSRFFDGANYVFADRLTINGAGNVGIGLSAPTQKLEIQDAAAGAAIKVSNTGGGSAQLAISSNATSVATLSFTNSLTLSGGNVGIGAGTPSGKLHVFGGDIFLGASYALKFSSTSYMTPENNVSGAEISTAGSLVVKTGATPAERIRVTDNGLTFNGDTAAANALDDYEEGTWTMGVSFGGASAGVTYTLNTGKYTKIGRQVTVTGYLVLSNKGSSTGDAKITGLPFTITNANENYAAATLWFNKITFANQFQGNGAINSTTITLEETTVLGVGSSLTDADFANDSNIILSFTYFV
jgi:hypothetical protein